MTTTTTRPSLFAARHEDSALFSVAALRRADVDPGPGRSDSSGFIDVHDLRAPAPAAGDLRSATPATPPTPPTRRRRSGGLHGLVAALSLALVGSLTAVAAPSPSAHAHDRDHGRDARAMSAAWIDDEFRGDVFVIPDAAADEAPEAAPEAPAIEPEPEPAPTTSRRTKTKASTSARKPATKAEATVREAAPSKPAPVVDAGPDPMSVECLLDPSTCKRPGADKPAPAPAKPEPGSALPDKLDVAALKAGVAGARSAAQRQCEGLASGADKVEVKLSIAGESGEVVQARAQGDAAGTAVAACVEKALTSARFDRFRAPQQGLTVTVRF